MTGGELRPMKTSAMLTRIVCLTSTPLFMPLMDLSRQYQCQWKLKTAVYWQMAKKSQSCRLRSVTYWTDLQLSLRTVFLIFPPYPKKRGCQHLQPSRNWALPATRGETTKLLVLILSLLNCTRMGEMILQIWEWGSVPSNFKDENILTMFKKGDRGKYKNYNRLSIIIW